MSFQKRMLSLRCSRYYGGGGSIRNGRNIDKREEKMDFLMMMMIVEKEGKERV